MRKALLQLHLAIFLAGFTAVLGRLISLNEAVLVWYRLILSVTALALWLSLRKKFIHYNFKTVLSVLLVGCLIAFHWVAFYGSIKYGNISIALVCLSAMSFFTAFFEPWIFKRKIDWIEVLLGVLAMIGIYIIFDFHPNYRLGVIFGILAALGSSLFPVFNKKLIVRFNPMVLTFYELLGGLIFLTVVLPIYLKFFPTTNFFPSNADWFWLMILAIVCTVFCFELQLNALKKVSAFTNNLSYNLEPVYGIIFAFIFFGEGKELNQQFYYGMILIALTIVIHSIREWYKRKNA